MTNLKYLLISSFFLFSTTTLAQNNFKEIGMAVGDEFNLSFVYKQQKSEQRYISYDLLFANFGVLSGSSSTIYSFNTGLSITFEKRKEIAEKVQFIHGWSPSLGVGFIGSGSESAVDAGTITPGLGYRLGFLYSFSENFYISLQGQVAARAALFINGDSENTPTSINVGFSQSDLGLNLVYRFRKKE